MIFQSRKESLLWLRRYTLLFMTKLKSSFSFISRDGKGDLRNLNNNTRKPIFFFSLSFFLLLSGFCLFVGASFYFSLAFGYVLCVLLNKSLGNETGGSNQQRNNSNNSNNSNNIQKRMFSYGKEAWRLLFSHDPQSAAGAWTSHPARNQTMPSSSVPQAPWWCHLSRWSIRFAWSIGKIIN